MEKKNRKGKNKIINFLFGEHKQITLGFSIFACILICIFTFLFLFIDNPTIVTISNMGNQTFTTRIIFIIWGSVTGLLFAICMLRMFNTYKFTSKKAKALVRLSYLFLILCTLLPSICEFPFLSKVHVVCGIGFSICCCLSIFFFLRYLKNVNKKIGNTSLILYFSALFFPALTFFIFGHCGVYEIVFFLVLALYLVVFEIYLRKHKNSLFPNKKEENEIAEIVNKENAETIDKYNKEIVDNSNNNQISMFDNSKTDELNKDVFVEKENEDLSKNDAEIKDEEINCDNVENEKTKKPNGKK